MARRSLRPELNRIRAWVRQGRTDAWIAHQLDVTVQQIQGFKKDQSLEATEEADGTGATTADFDDEIDLRAEDDALIAAELDAAVAEREAAEAAAAEAAEKAAAEKAARGDSDDEDDDKPARRRRGRRGGRGGRGRKRSGPLEATFDHGEEGYGLWLDPAVQDDPVYAESWAGHRAVEVTIEEEQIVIRRIVSGDDAEDAGDEE